MSELLLDRAGRRRSPATMPGFHAGRPPHNKGLRYPADPPKVEEIIAVMRAAGDRPHGRRLRALIVLLWRAGLRIHEALALTEGDLDQRRGSLLIRPVKLLGMSVALLPVTRDNVDAVCELAVHEHQRRFVAPAAKTVAEAKVHEPGAFLRAIAVDERPVGVLWVQTDEPAPYLVRFMVDASWQGRGIGRHAVALLLDDLRAAGHTELELSYVPAEDGAERFWLNCGFEPTGRMHGGEVVVRMDL
jgi:diamine N-acetyltransferase